MRIGLTYDLQTDPHDPRQAEFDPPRVIEAVCAALESLGHDVVRLGAPRALLTSPLAARNVELVFNIAEGGWGRCREAWAPTLLELLGVPYVGSDALALALSLDKLASKRVAVAEGVRTPRWVVVADPSAWDGRTTLAYPLIVKPRYEGSGAGIDEDAIVQDHAALRRRVEAVFARFHQDVLMEEFIPAGELTVCLIGNDPPTVFPAIQRPLDPHSRLAYHVCAKPPASWVAPLMLDEPLDAEARRIARVMFEALGCRDMARVDLRVDDHGRPFLLEINPLPSFDPEGSVGLLAECLGRSYADVVGMILDAAIARLQAAGQPVESRA